jgi:hypothetical protein
VSKIPYSVLFKINASMIGSSVVNFTRHWLGLIVIATPKICRVLTRLDDPGCVVVTVIGSKKSRPKAATMPES